MAQAPAEFGRERHVKYWRRNHQSLLPTPYTASDSTRLTFACFILSALDLLSVPLTAEERSAARRWVLSLQHPDGGFCGSSTHVLPGSLAPRGTANIAATFFALVLLGTVADGEEEAAAAFAGVERTKLLRWMRRLQREDGSFGQCLWEGKPVGGSDMRHSYLAACIRWMLSGGELAGSDINVETMIAYLRAGQSYDGGVAQSARNESHAGYVYCGVAALAMLDRDESLGAVDRGIPDKNQLLKFLSHRQFTYLAKAEEENEDEEENLIESKLGELSLEESEVTAEGTCQHVGFNGRWSKKADTCYCWWTGGTLRLLGHAGMIKTDPSRRFLLDITQHPMGGFGKVSGAPPDILHSYLGLASLAILEDPNVKALDAGLCCSQETTRKIIKARDGLLSRTSKDSSGWKNDGFWDAIGTE